MKFLHNCLKVLCVAVLALATTQATAQEQERTAKETVTVLEAIKKTVVYIQGSYVENGAPKSWSGTAFLIFQSDPGLTNKGITWLVTNKHMLKQPMPNGEPGQFFKEMTIRSNTLATAPERGHFRSDTVPVIDGAGNLLWCVHPDDSVDLALLRAGPNLHELDIRATRTEQFLTNDLVNKLNVNENDECLFTGLFAAYPGIERNFPIVRHGKIALISNERIPVKAGLSEELILAEVTTFGGNSGSPVFLRLGGIREGATPTTGYDYYLLGVMQGFFSEGTDLALEVTSVLRGTVSQNSGIAAVIPAQKILEILQTPRASAKTRLAVALAYVNDGKFTEGERMLKEAVEMSEKAVGPEHPDVADALEPYAIFLRKQGRLPDALRVEARTREIRARNNPSTKPQ